jgi:small ligand-binding sensory domain FIST
MPPSNPPTATSMRFHASISGDPSAERAVAQVISEVKSSLDGRVDVAFAFLTAQHLDDAAMVLEKLWVELDPQTVVGCSAEGVIGGDQEIERGPGLSLLAAEMPGVRIHPFHVAGESDWREVLPDPDALRDRIGCGPETRAVIGFGDPFSTPAGQFLPAMDLATPGVSLIGGMASGAREPGGNVLFRNDEAFDSGIVGVSVSEPLEVQTLVSQGCRPVGRPMVITRSHDNVVEQLGGKPALGVLRELVMGLGNDEKAMLSKGLFLGRAISEYRETFGRGDFLVRNIIGLDEEKGWLGVADYVRTGQTVQFQIRDAATANEDLSEMLNARRSDEGAQPAGALLFSCNGRGTRLFREPCHDIGLARRAMPATPVAGFFAAGEFGPVGGKNFIHGHTASFALFRST